MRVSREQVAENRQTILEAASGLFRERGFEAVSVADVMEAAGLTHGGFYGYFKSKDDLITCALAHTFESDNESVPNLLKYAEEYLSPEHRDDLSGGCLTAGLGAETIRQSVAARAVMTEVQRSTIDRFSKGTGATTPREARRMAIGTWAAMIGAMVLARLSSDPELSDEILSETYQWIKWTSIKKPTE
ncbi:TetR/AcrR family transcriptional regulator [Paraburkholderia caribensis]|uniref:TetR/AcrR family transcriptional regulator n=1 Tax=Paraburkholderia caribensis TaxID=75105 RepID=UPI0034D36144